MAEERVDLPMASEVTKSSGVELRRHSTGKASSGNNEEKVIPHYLRASTGSCHDLCKYGRKHAFEANERPSISKRAVRKPLHRSADDSIGGRIMISVAKLRSSIDSKPSKMFDSKLQKKSLDSQKQIGNDVLANRNKTSLVKVKPSLCLNSHISSIPKTRSQGISSTSNVKSPSKSTSKKEETQSKSASRRMKTHSKPTPLESASGKVKTHSKPTSQMVKALSKSTSKKMGTSSKLSSLKGKEMEFSEKHVISLNPNFGDQRDSEIKMEKREASCKVASPVRALLSSKPSPRRTASTNARKHKNLKIVSHLKNQPKPRIVEPMEHNDEVEEKTLYVIKVESENQTLQSYQNVSQDVESSLSHSLSSPNSSSSSIFQSSSQENQDEFDYATSEFEDDSSSGNHETECMENEESLEVEENGKPQKDGNLEDKDCKMLKLKLARGKLVETQIEKSSPRKLKFRRGKVLGDHATDVKVGADNIGATTDQEKVVLRHLDVQGKKDGQRLFNKVIEETATKLVQSKKSKVKALVGAFETVISLQEKKHFGNIVS